MPKPSPIKAGLVIAASILALLLVTYTVVSFYEGMIPVGEGLELWSTDREHGCSLILPAPGEGRVALKELASNVSGIAKSNGAFIVQQRDGVLLIVSKEGQSWSAREALPGSIEAGTVSFDKPGDLKERLIFREYWWVFVLEITCGLVLSAALLLVQRWWWPDLFGCE